MMIQTQPEILTKTKEEETEGEKAKKYAPPKKSKNKQKTQGSFPDDRKKNNECTRWIFSGKENK